MPHIGSTEVDRAGVQLMREWIQQIPLELAKDHTGDDVAEQLRHQEDADLHRLMMAAAVDREKLVSDLLATTSGALLVLQSIDSKTLTDEVASLVLESATKHPDARIRDLFERFLPPEIRTKRLGSVVQPDQILSMSGDTARGKQVFFATDGVQCINCHKIQKEGKELGPDLSAIGKKYTAAQLLESILEPSKRIDPQYVSYLVETDEGRLLTGLLVRKNGKEVVLKDTQNKEILIPAEQIEQIVPQARSMMPELLLRDMTAQQVADLLAYLNSLK